MIRRGMWTKVVAGRSGFRDGGIVVVVAERRDHCKKGR